MGQHPGVLAILVKGAGVERFPCHLAHPLEIGARAKMRPLGAQQQHVGAVGEGLAVGQLVEAVEQPLHQVGIEGVVTGRAGEHQLDHRAVALQAKMGKGIVEERV